MIRLASESEELLNLRSRSAITTTITGTALILCRKDTNKNLEPRKGYQQEPSGAGSYIPQTQSRSVERPNQQQYQPEEFKPSVRVHNPPGGRSNFQLG